MRRQSRTSFSRLLLLLALVASLVAASDFSALDQKAGGAGTGGGTGTGAGNGAGTGSAAKQFHLSFIGASKTNAKLLHYALDWVTPATTTSSQLVYGTSADALTTRVNAKSSGTVDEGAGKTVMCWSALVQNVAAGSTIYYALADDTSKPKSFTAQPADGFTWAVFGDLGAPAQKGASGVALPALKNALDVTKAYHGVLNIGDLAYELVGSNGKNHMDELESITSKVPMQTTVGNHEYQYGLAPDFVLQNYYRRFSGLTLGVGTVSGSYSNEFYSFDSGLVHFVFINTEVYGDEAFATLQADGKTWKADEAARTAMAATQVDWLAYDLSRVRRSETPYVIVCGHRPPFKTPGPLSLPGNKFAKEIVPLMSKYQVDLYLAGHEHTYLMFEASTFKDFNVPPIIISGSPGNNEFIRTEAELNIKGFTWKTHIPKYGFGYLTATKESLKWQWGSAATDASHKPGPAMWTMEDELTIPRRTSFATVTPEGKPVKTPGDLSTVWASAKNETGGSGGRDGAGDAGVPSGKSNSSKPDSAATAPQNSAASTHASLLVGAVATLVALLSIQLVQAD